MEGRKKGGRNGGKEGRKEERRKEGKGGREKRWEGWNKGQKEKEGKLLIILVSFQSLPIPDYKTTQDKLVHSSRLLFLSSFDHIGAVASV